MDYSSGMSDDLFSTRKRRRTRVHRSSRSDEGATRAHGAGSTSGVPAEELQDQRTNFIRTTIAKRSWETHFQPIVDLRSGGAVGAEALSRFVQGPTRAPDKWFDEAASVGLGVELEVAALDTALEQLPRLPSKLYLSVNASVETIMSPDFADVLSDVPAERIVLELTEHTQVTDYVQFEQGIATLRSQGVRLAVDDTGAGFASLQHVLNLRPDVIKLDIALTRGIDRDPARRALGRALLSFGLDAYNASIVAEGIETEGELEVLRALGCPCGQGFYLGRPSRLTSAPFEPTPRALTVVTGTGADTDLPRMVRSLLQDLDDGQATGSPTADGIITTKGSKSA